MAKIPYRWLDKNIDFRNILKEILFKLSISNEGGIADISFCKYVVPNENSSILLTKIAEGRPT